MNVTYLVFSGVFFEKNLLDDYFRKVSISTMLSNLQLNGELALGTSIEYALPHYPIHRTPSTKPRYFEG